MARVRLESVTKNYGDVPVIPTLDLEIADREFVVLVGPSGCGKTTTLRMIAGLEGTTSGTIRIGDRDVTQLRPGLRNCAMVFQNYALYPHMSVRENIGYGMKVRREPKAEIEAKIKEAARILGLDPYLDRRPKQLSGGQRQRVAIGRAIVRDPDVFLFDEPLSNLDAKLRIEMRAEIKALHRRLKTTIVYVTHDQVEAMTMADRVVVMNQGRIEQAAEPLTLYETPANLFVAAFIGAPSMNFLPATLMANGGAPGLRLVDGTVLPVPSAKRTALAGRDGLAITIGLRPEHVAGGEAGPVVLPIMPRVIEPLGAHTLILGEVAGGRFTAQVDAHYPAQPDEPTTISLDPERLHLFETAGGQAI
jgi:multiple sugar transport system ATP-binding protein